MPKATCSADGCNSDVTALGLCNKHYLRLRKTGQLESRPRPTPLERLMSRVQKMPDGCWLWSGGRRPDGYGLISVSDDGSRNVGVHVLSWELHRGSRGGLFVCHRCDVRHCVNPDHLFLGTHLDNMRDMRDKGRSTKGRVLATSCRNGHEYTPENTQVGPDGKKRCIACQKQRSREFYLRSKGAAA